MANSRSDAPSGGGPFDPEEAERLAELFQASWEALPSGGSSGGAPAAQPPAPAKSPTPGTADQSFDRRGAITVPEVPAANHKRTLLGIPTPVATLPVAESSPFGPPASPFGPTGLTPQAAADARAANKRTLLGVAPPTPVRGPSPSQPDAIKVPSQAPPPPPPPPPPIPVGQSPEPVPAATKSSPRSSRPSGVAKIYVPKEGADTPAVVVDEAALRDGQAAAAAEEARRRARSNTSRSAQTMRARPGEFDLPIGTRKRTGLWIGVTVVGLLGVAGALFLLQPGSESEVEPANSELSTATPPTAVDPQIPVVPSPDAMQAKSAAAAPQRPPSAPAETRAEPPAPVPAPQAKVSRVQPANRSNPQKRASEAPRSSPAPESKKAEPQKKNVIVRDAPF